MMQTILASVGSKKLMLVGVVLGLVVEDAMAKSWTAAHLFAVAIVTFGYCIGQGLVDALAASKTLDSVQNDPKKITPIEEIKPGPPPS
jgi:hypothetical protein